MTKQKMQEVVTENQGGMETTVGNIVATTIDLSTKFGKIMLMNAQTGASLPLKSVKSGDVIRVTDVLIHMEEGEFDGKTGTQTVTTLFEENGNAYAGISATVAKSAKVMVETIFDGGVEWVDVKVVKQKSNGGREFINLIAVNVG